MGMSDLGEPPVSAGFTEEVALSRRGWGSYARLVATIDGADAGAGGVRKPNWSILLENAVNYANSRSSNVPSGSQQTDRWQDVFL